MTDNYDDEYLPRHVRLAVFCQEIVPIALILASLAITLVATVAAAAFIRDLANPDSPRPVCIIGRQ